MLPNGWNKWRLCYRVRSWNDARARQDARYAVRATNCACDPCGSVGSARLHILPSCCHDAEMHKGIVCNDGQDFEKTRETHVHGAIASRPPGRRYRYIPCPSGDGMGSFSIKSASYTIWSSVVFEHTMVTGESSLKFASRTGCTSPEPCESTAWWS